MGVKERGAASCHVLVAVLSNTGSVCDHRCCVSSTHNPCVMTACTIACMYGVGIMCAGMLWLNVSNEPHVCVPSYLFMPLAWEVGIITWTAMAVVEGMLHSQVVCISSRAVHCLCSAEEQVFLHHHWCGGLFATHAHRGLVALQQCAVPVRFCVRVNACLQAAHGAACNAWLCFW